MQRPIAIRQWGSPGAYGMPREERDRLLELFLEAAKAHSDAAHAMLGGEVRLWSGWLCWRNLLEKLIRTATMRWKPMSVTTDATRSTK